MRFNYDVATDTLDDQAQNALDFNKTSDGGAYDIEAIFSYLLHKKTSPLLEATASNGVEIIESNFDADAKTAMITFKRPLDVSYDISFFLQPEEEYKLYIVWGVFDDDDATKRTMVKGITGLLADKGLYKAHDNGEKWVL